MLVSVVGASDHAEGAPLVFYYVLFTFGKRSLEFSIVLIVVGTRLVPDLLHRNPTSCDLYVMLLSVLSSLTFLVSRLTVNQ